MKKQLIIVYTLALAAVLGLAACSDKKFEEINTDPNRPVDVPTTTILSVAQKLVIDNARGSAGNFRSAMLFAQYFSQNQYVNESRYDLPRSASDTYWDNAYKALNNLEQIIRLNTDPATKLKVTANVGPNENQIAIARILKVYTFLSLTDAFGNIPYSSYGNNDADFQALKVNPEIVSPKYAPQEKIYPDLLNELKEAAAQIDVSANTFGNYDGIYKGKPDLWKKFANSLRLRIATRVRAKLPQVAETHIQEAIAGGLISSNAENAVLKYEAKAPNEAPLYRSTVTENRRDFSVSHILINVLKGTAGPFTAPDPRLPVYARTNNKGEYLGQPYGLDARVASILKAEDISLPGALVNAADYGEVLIEYAEVCFLLSEYRNWDAAEYIKGVRASLQKWGVAANAENAYVNALPAASQETVLSQKYLALYMQGNEAWAEIRRTGFPKFLVKPGDVVWPNAPFPETEYTKFNPVVGSGIPSRIYYPQKEQTVNLASYEAAVAAQGNDVLDTKLWWNK
ncbi:SusD/RagB family nutrient-binding outer membrane lipoprotein [Chitinophaga alhagiae]|uniref:SusD/RagB family nutrient-binding outer membrane lipoprotein n=1 Tax=Chitinophaga alhagiae TaxID=2203219 RepID=A0ABN5LWR9_9BACT|nr:SusD/RagB family nutrient-binding outer membrane lipoprotein [Chitinophaga alhagiae]AWO00612.1 SusD/RagB family nutrient-binding outer membrane lipoprotein [Chitinophaga alhagiae]